MGKKKNRKKLAAKAAVKSIEAKKSVERREVTLAAFDQMRNELVVAQEHADNADAAMRAIVEATQKSRSKDAKAACDIACGFLQTRAPKVEVA